ncbi:phytochrome family protein [Psychroserpens mesophilus]|uniref:HAMP domain-containing sensor histidine kinase n=1 Tax=Psychroserpens mesophilus TaxID=325473 RepID=UPI00058C7606|nr:HAMP domain-containing sensor histidine kinase [Psychroserpens mesophilus]
MNKEMRMKLNVEKDQAIGQSLEHYLTVGSKIFYQTHLNPLIKMQNSVREIYLVFQGKNAQIPVLLNFERIQTSKGEEIHCGGMEISKRNKYEKELLIAKQAAEKALEENAELIKAKNELVHHQKTLEAKYREVKSLKVQQQEVFKLIAHDLQEPLRKSIFMTSYILSKHNDLPNDIVESLSKIGSYNADMSEMLQTLLRFKELEDKALVIKDIELTQLIRDTIIELQMHNNQDIEITYPLKPINLQGDETLIKRLFKVLLRNSQKDQNHENDKLIIEILANESIQNSYVEISDKYHYDKYIKITYCDNGYGFNNSLKKIINKTDLFNKVNIGLAYCKQIIEKHSGIMEAKSVEGKGVYYKILIPFKST